MPGIIPPGHAPVSAKQPKPAKPKVLPSGTGAVNTLLQGKGQPVKLPGGETVTLNVRALQSQLRKDGYDIKVDGKLGPQTLSALRDYYKPGSESHMSNGLQQVLRGGPLLGTRNPTAWNKRFGTPDTRSPAYRTPAAKPGGSLDVHGNDVTAQYAPPGQDVNLSDPHQQEQMVAAMKSIPESLAKFGSMINPSTADAIAGEQFDPQIRESQLALAKDPLQAKMNAKDIAAWYGQALKALATAGTRDTAAEHAGVSSVGDAGKALVASLGGGANAGAGDVASASQNAEGTLAAEQVAQDQYNNDLAPLMRGESAGMLTSQANKDAAQQRADQLALENLQGQRGQAETTAQADITDRNNALAAQRASFLEGIKKDNNAMAQQGFQNSLALAQAQIAAMMSGLKVQGLQQKTAGTNLKYTQPFLAASPSIKNQAYQQALGSLYDPTTKQKLNLTPQQAMTRIQSVYSSFGFHPAPGTPSGAAAAGVLHAWQTAG